MYLFIYLFIFLFIYLFTFGDGWNNYCFIVEHKGITKWGILDNFREGKGLLQSRAKVISKVDSAKQNEANCE